MELKLLILTHKKDYGSMINFCGGLKEDEKNILESIVYRKYKPNINEMKELSINGYHVYFIIFVGGKDEFGRDYRTVISAIFPFQLSVKEGEKLRKTFLKIKEDIEMETFNSQNKYYVEIRKKTDWEAFFPKKNVKLNIAIILITMFLIVIGILLGFNQLKPINELNKYIYLKHYSIIGKSNLKKYTLTKELINLEQENLSTFLEKADDQKFKEIKTFISENPYEFKKILVIIKEYLDVDDFKKNRNAIRKIQNDIVIQMDE